MLTLSTQKSQAKGSGSSKQKAHLKQPLAVLLTLWTNNLLTKQFVHLLNKQFVLALLISNLCPAYPQLGPKKLDRKAVLAPAPASILAVAGCLRDRRLQSPFVKIYPIRCQQFALQFEKTLRPVWSTPSTR